MQIVMGFIYQALVDMGYKPVWNKSETGLVFNFNMMCVMCRADPKSRIVTFMVPNVFTIVYDEYNDIVSRVNARNYIGRLVYMDESSVAAVSSFFAESYENVPVRAMAAICDLEGLVNASILSAAFFSNRQKESRTAGLRSGRETTGSSVHEASGAFLPWIRSRRS